MSKGTHHWIRQFWRVCTKAPVEPRDEPNVEPMVAGLLSSTVRRRPTTSSAKAKLRLWLAARRIETLARA